MRLARHYEGQDLCQVLQAAVMPAIMLLPPPTRAFFRPVSGGTNWKIAANEPCGYIEQRGCSANASTVRFIVLRRYMASVLQSPSSATCRHS